jgi:hypothetical protein
VRARVVGGCKRTNDELTGFDRLNRVADLFDRAAVLVAHRCRPVDRLQPAIGPQVRSAHACDGDADYRIRGLFDLWRRTILKADIAQTVENGSLHELGSLPFAMSTEGGVALAEYLVASAQSFWF